MRCPALVIALILFTTLDVVYPQTPPARSGPGGTINGLVKDSTGAVLGKATVTLTGNATTPEATPPQAAPVQSVQTQDDGTYVFRGVAPGTYTVSATYTGLTQSNIVAVMLKDSETVRGDITMKPAE